MMDDITHVVLFMLTIKITGLSLVIYLMWLGHRGLWLHYIMCYFGISLGLWWLMNYVISEQHFDPSVTALDIVVVCWLWHRSKGAVREGC